MVIGFVLKNVFYKAKLLLVYLFGFLMLSKFAFAVGFAEDPIERFKIGSDNAPVTFYM